MKIYKAAKNDIDRTAELFNLYRMFYEQESDLQGAKTYIKERIENKDSVIFIVEDNERLVGFTQLYPAFSSISMKRTWILNDLYVVEDGRKQGAGEMLLQKAKEYAIETGAKSISLSTARANDKAQRLYKKQGYEQDSNFLYYELNIK